MAKKIPKTKAERVANITRRAHTLFGEFNGRKWLKSKIMSLGGQRPIDLAKTARGYQRVDTILDAIESGAFL